MRRSAPVVVAAALVLTCAYTVGAFAANLDGGTSIATAPELPLNQNQVNGVTSPLQRVCNDVSQRAVQFWRVTMQTADLLTLDIGNLANIPLSLYVLPPQTTDYTLADTNCAFQFALGVSEKKEWSFRAPTAGRWILVLRGNNAGTQHSVLSYEFTAQVRAFTRASIIAPRLVKSKKPFKVTGTVAGGNKLSGNAVLRIAKSGSTTRKIVHVKSGRFAVKIRLSKPGVYRLVVAFPGDSSHLPSSAKMRVEAA